MRNVRCSTTIERLWYLVEFSFLEKDPAASILMKRSNGTSPIERKTDELMVYEFHSIICEVLSQKKFNHAFRCNFHWN
jgi:hypothetical protein